VTPSRSVSKGTAVTPFLNPSLPIHYTTFIGLRWRLRVVYRWASPLLRPFWREILSRQKLAKNLRFGGKPGRNVKFCFRGTQKAHPCAKRRYLTYRSWKSVQRASLYDVARTHKKLAESLCTRRHERELGSGAKTPYRTVMKFCTWVGVSDIITCAKFCGHRFRGFGDKRGQSNKLAR